MMHLMALALALVAIAIPVCMMRLAYLFMKKPATRRVASR